MENEPPNSSDGSSQESPRPADTKRSREVSSDKILETLGGITDATLMKDIDRLIGAQSTFYESLVDTLKPSILGLQPALISASLNTASFHTISASVAQLSSASNWLEPYQASISKMLEPNLTGLALASAGLTSSAMYADATASLGMLSAAASIGSASHFTLLNDTLADTLAKQSDRMREIIQSAAPALNLAYFSQSGGPLDVLGEIRQSLKTTPLLHENLFQALAATQGTSALGRNYGGLANTVRSLADSVGKEGDQSALDDQVDRLLDAEQATREDVHQLADMLGWIRSVGSGVRRTRSEDIAFGLIIGMCIFAFHDPSELWLPGRLWESLAGGAAATIAIGVFRRTSDDEGHRH